VASLPTQHSHTPRSSGIFAGTAAAWYNEQLTFVIHGSTIFSETLWRLRLDSELRKEVERRRTFAIISHPDAGKTTLTEKLLLYAGAVHLAGSVRARKNHRHATSDWMEIERQRGISITSTVLQFEYGDYCINLLDTPGHEDFSEDTYRTLTAADNAVMLIDSGKGIESQTLKLFDVCRMRKIPIFTFMNKMDRPSRDPIDLLDEIERVLEIGAFPMNWPIGSGPSFRGVFDRLSNKVHLFERTEHGATEAPFTVTDAYDPALEQLVDAGTYKQFRDEIELLDMAGHDFDRERLRAGTLTPVYFGSAVTNFGVQLFLDSFTDLAMIPSARDTASGPVNPEDEGFSGFVFKIQANMDPKHRDSVAFLRVCSGRFEKDMSVYHSRLGTKIRLSRPHKLFARERETVETAFPGDILGLINPGSFAIGDTVSMGRKVEFEGVPQFAPENFAVMRCPNTGQYKQFHKGLDQLLQEGAVQVLYSRGGSRSEPILAAVGKLQFEVVQHRMMAEYSVEVLLDNLAFEKAAWLQGNQDAITQMRLPSSSKLVEDADGRLVALFGGEWELNYAKEKNPDVSFLNIAPIRTASRPG
jgi:peptide chain release factor 3